MNLSATLNIEPTTSLEMEPAELPNAVMRPFTPGKCLFCPVSSQDFSDSVTHMQRSHGLFIPYEQHLLVDLETLFKYLHLVIFSYRECLQCGTERATVEAVQQHMTAKGHCRFDVSEVSEFSEFYDFYGPEGNAETATEVESNEEEQDERPSRTSMKPVLADEDSIRLPSGKIISRQSSAPTRLSFSHLHQRRRNSPSKVKHSLEESNEEKGFGGSELDSEPSKQLLSRREKRERATVSYQLAKMSANDRNSLMHLPASQQRSLLAVENRHGEKVQKEQQRRQTRIDRKGNKNLYAYWHTETPVYQCG
ncbi:TRI15 [Colletotrichum truncatum]|uniref:TRI15 n=1 Tax=Colletotrichum truncatum TaxID=5467 RepID=A0ACC3Z804_COLTU|nr:TRI15 [Colletotrichum truncatum]KAF6783713.1 TRI15 [Colletotrichum truncatum]